MTAATERLDLCGPLPSGRMAVEASAGTGKTYALAAFATRFLAEHDVTAADLLVVTFTRAATAELRSRIREKVVAAAEHLAVVAGAGSDPSTVADPGDAVLAHLAATDVDRRLARLRRAVTEFDHATVTTIHGFAAQVLGTLGVAAGVDAVDLVDDSAELAAECCADELAAAALVHDHSLLPSLTQLVEATRTAINLPDVRLEPDPDREDLAEEFRVRSRLVRDSIERMRRRRREAGTLSFDDVLVELRNALDGPGSAAALAALRDRYRVALIDEFQDTDPVQWDIFDRVFDVPSGGAPASSLVLVGDPKQAIYSFRGANVRTYLDAARSCAERRTMDRNWRSDGAVLTATRALFDGVTFGHEDIGFVPVEPAPDHAQRRARLVDGGVLPAVEVRLALRDLPTNPSGSRLIKKGKADARISEDAAEHIRDLLETVRLPTDDGERAARPSDVAVLVRNNRAAEAMRADLSRLGVPAVLSRGASVLESLAAEQWRILVEALQRPGDPTRARAAALGWFLGHDAGWVAGADDDQLAELQEQLHEWSSLLVERGFVELRQRLWAESGVTARVLSRPEGDRELTDLQHVAELLADRTGAEAGERTGPAALLAVLDAPGPVLVEADVDRDVTARRIDSDARAVQIMTVWVAKGLEFPIVCVPGMWSRPRERCVYSDGATGERRIDITNGKSWPDAAAARERKERAAMEALGEDTRLLYVALTRAVHHTAVWWTRSDRYQHSALTRLLLARCEDGTPDADASAATTTEVGSAEEVAGRLAPLVERSGGTIRVLEVPPASPRRWIGASGAADPADLTVARLARRPDRSRHRWSFTALTAVAERHGDPADPTLGDARAGDEAGSGAGGPEAVGDLGTGGRAGPGEHGEEVDVEGDAPVSELADLPAGAAFGTLAHAVLEHVDPSSEDVEDQLRAQVGLQLSRWPVDLDGSGVPSSVAADDAGAGPSGAELLVAGLRRAAVTPLGPLFGDLRLCDVPARDRLVEMDFDLRLGDGPATVTVPDLAASVASHLVPADLFDRQPFAGWAEGLVEGPTTVLAGHLTGSIDAILRLPGTNGEPRYVVVDYKTNRLTARGAAARTGDYAPDAMAAAMEQHDYPLQALLYSVALHRYLRWRQPGYDPSVHLGGVAYLFLRGMCGPGTPISDGTRHGVFAWRVPPALVVELSDLLAGQRSGAVR